MEEDNIIRPFYESQSRLIYIIREIMGLYEDNIKSACKKTGITYSTLSAILSGHRDAGQTSRSNVLLISKYLKISVVDYYYFAGFLKDEDFHDEEQNRTMAIKYNHGNFNNDLANMDNGSPDNLYQRSL